MPGESGWTSGRPPRWCTPACSAGYATPSTPRMFMFGLGIALVTPNLVALRRRLSCSSPRYSSRSAVSRSRICCGHTATPIAPTRPAWAGSSRVSDRFASESPGDIVGDRQAVGRPPARLLSGSAARGCESATAGPRDDDAARRPRIPARLTRSNAEPIAVSSSCALRGPAISAVISCRTRSTTTPASDKQLVERRPPQRGLGQRVDQFGRQPRVGHHQRLAGPSLPAHPHDVQQLAGSRERFGDRQRWASRAELDHVDLGFELGLS